MFYTGTFYAYNSSPSTTKPAPAARGDYAINAGDPRTSDVLVPEGGGPSSLAKGIDGFLWCTVGTTGKIRTTASGEPDPCSDEMNGVSFQRSEIKTSHIVDGLSHTYLVGERYIDPLQYETGVDLSDNETWCTGYDNDNFRSTHDPPQQDTPGVAGWPPSGAFIRGPSISRSVTDTSNRLPTTSTRRCIGHAESAMTATRLCTKASRMWKSLQPIHFAATSMLVACVAGCGGSSRGAAVRPPEVDAAASARRALEQYDQDRNGRLSATELQACPAIYQRRERYDSDGDGEISGAELSDYFDKMYAQGAGLVEVTCIVRQNGRPLTGAQVRLIPEEFLGGVVQPATALTDARGAATPAIAADHLPDRLRNLRMMQVGIYRVEISHPSLTSPSPKPLGLEVNSSVADGAAAVFDL